MAAKAKPLKKVPRFSTSSMKWLILALVVVGATTIGSLMTLHSNASTCYSSPTLWRSGSRGTCVGYIQQMIDFQVAYSSKWYLQADNRFGPLTESSVMHVQSLAGITVDGVVGPQTWKALCYPKYRAGVRLPNGIYTDYPGYFDTLAHNAGCPTLFQLPRGVS